MNTGFAKVVKQLKDVQRSYRPKDLTSIAPVERSIEHSIEHSIGALANGQPPVLSAARSGAERRSNLPSDLPSNIPSSPREEVALLKGELQASQVHVYTHVHTHVDMLQASHAVYVHAISRRMPIRMSIHMSIHMSVRMSIRMSITRLYVCIFCRYTGGSYGHTQSCLRACL